MDSAVSMPPAETFAPSDLLSDEHLAPAADWGDLPDIPDIPIPDIIASHESLLENIPISGERVDVPPTLISEIIQTEAEPATKADVVTAEPAPTAPTAAQPLAELPAESPAEPTRTEISASSSTEIPIETPVSPPIDPRQTLRWQNEVGKISLHLPPEITNGLTLDELWQQLQHRLNTAEQLWPPHTPVELWAGQRLLDQRELQNLAEQLATAKLVLKRIHTQRRQTAIAAASSGYAVEQEAEVMPLSSGLSSALPIAEPLYLNTNLRSGTEICHAGSVIILGDLNPGSSIIADGDIIVWGRLRGTVHAGAKGNRRCRIMALQMEATLLRIADLVARVPKPTSESYPEVAYATPEGIRLCHANEKKWAAGGA